MLPQPKRVHLIFGDGDSLLVDVLEEISREIFRSSCECAEDISLTSLGLQAERGVEAPQVCQIAWPDGRTAVFHLANSIDLPLGGHYLSGELVPHR
ncbi:MAG: hypothetical protein VKP62_11230 [Candidatus Sericytochromatia bacterium]|nr:hypothetical protein [Candidatus Sericytochromatia bacterium]